MLTQFSSSKFTKNIRLISVILRSSDLIVVSFPRSKIHICLANKSFPHRGEDSLLCTMGSRSGKGSGGEGKK